MGAAQPASMHLASKGTAAADARLLADFQRTGQGKSGEVEHGAKLYLRKKTVIAFSLFSSEQAHFEILDEAQITANFQV